MSLLTFLKQLRLAGPDSLFGAHGQSGDDGDWAALAKKKLGDQGEAWPDLAAKIATPAVPDVPPATLAGAGAAAAPPVAPGLAAGAPMLGGKFPGKPLWGPAAGGKPYDKAMMARLLAQNSYGQNSIGEWGA